MSLLAIHVAMYWCSKSVCPSEPECSPQSHELHPRIPLARDHDDHLLHLTHLHHQSQQLSDIHLATFLDLEQGTDKSSRMTMFPSLKGEMERVSTAFPHHTAYANWEQYLRNRLKEETTFLDQNTGSKTFPIFRFPCVHRWDSTLIVPAKSTPFQFQVQMVGFTSTLQGSPPCLEATGVQSSSWYKHYHHPARLNQYCYTSLADNKGFFW